MTMLLYNKIPILLAAIHVLASQGTKKLTKVTSKYAVIAGDAPTSCGSHQNNLNDGNLKTCEEAISPTVNESAYFTVDLKHKALVGELHIDAYLGGPGMKGIYAVVSDTETFDDNSPKKCNIFNQSDNQPHWHGGLKVKCNDLQAGRFIHIARTGRKYNKLYMCELTIFVKTENCFGPPSYPICSKTCYCEGDKACNNRTGVCPNNACAKRHYGKSCDKTCPKGKFYSSKNGSCTGTCRCFDKDSCRVKDGFCLDKQCDPGWAGKDCQDDLSVPIKNKDGKAVSKGGSNAVVGAVVGVLIIIVTAVGAFIYYKKKIQPLKNKKKDPKKKRKADQKDKDPEKEGDGS